MHSAWVFRIALQKEEVTGQTVKLEKYLAAVRQAGAEAVPVSLSLPTSEFAHWRNRSTGWCSPAAPQTSIPRVLAPPGSRNAPIRTLHREDTDFALLEHAFAENKPVLAICYGIQSLNVYLGGTLIQDIPMALGTEIEHDHENDRRPSRFTPLGSSPEPGWPNLPLAPPKRSSTARTINRSKIPGAACKSSPAPPTA